MCSKNEMQNEYVRPPPPQNIFCAYPVNTNKMPFYYPFYYHTSYNINVKFLAFNRKNVLHLRTD